MSRLKPMTLIVGPCVIEDRELAFEVADSLKKQLAGLPLEVYFKSSFDKANRTSIEGFRGPGLREGLKILDEVRARTGFRVLTDFHDVGQADQVAEVVDFIQIPAFLCRQTDLIVAGAEAALKYARRLNVKKGQFLAPWDAKNIVEKVRAVEAKHGVTPARKDWFCLTERGVTFGYGSLVVDMSGIPTMRAMGVPVIFDATHSVQQPGAGAGGKSTGGKREHIETLARAAIAAGADALFMETHPRPEAAKSDGPNAFRLESVGEFIRQLLKIRELVSSMPKLMIEAQALEKNTLQEKT